MSELHGRPAKNQHIDRRTLGGWELCRTPRNARASGTAHFLDATTPSLGGRVTPDWIDAHRSRANHLLCPTLALPTAKTAQASGADLASLRRPVPPVRCGATAANESRGDHPCRVTR